MNPRIGSRKKDSREGTAGGLTEDDRSLELSIIHLQW